MGESSPLARFLLEKERGREKEREGEGEGGGRGEEEYWLESDKCVS